jgi:hypothetical protein
LSRRISNFETFVALIGSHKLHADQKGLQVDEAYANQLKRLIETQHGAKSTFAKSVRIHRQVEGQANWDGLVHVFDLNNHPKAKRAFAWSSPISGGGGPRFFAVLQMDAITTPIQAVKAASAAIRQWGARGTKNQATPAGR